MPDDKPVVNLDGDDEYQRRIDRVKGGPKVPVGGVAMPKIPSFADQAQSPDRFAGVQRPNQLLSPDQMARLASEGKLIPGVGSAYAANQPAAAGLGKEATPAAAPEPETITAAPGEKFANPPRPEGAGISSKTADALKAVAEANQTPEKVADEVKKDLEEVEEEFAYDEFGNRVRNMLANKQRRLAIEGRCPVLSFDDLIIHRELRQRVPIIPGRFEPTFRTTSGSEDLEIKRRMVGNHGSDQFILTRFALMSLCAGVFAINGQPLPNHLTAEGDFDDKLFDAKFKYITKFPVALLADLGVNFKWFDDRVRKLMIVDEIKGF